MTTTWTNTKTYDKFLSFGNRWVRASAIDALLPAMDDSSTLVLRSGAEVVVKSLPKAVVDRVVGPPSDAGGES